MKKITLSKTSLIVVACNFILGSLWIGPLAVLAGIPEWELPSHTMQWIYFDDALICIYILSLCGVVFWEGEIAKRVFIGLAFLILLHNIYYTLSFDEYTFPLVPGTPGRHIFTSSTFVEYAFPLTPEKEAAIVSMDSHFWWRLTESIRCFLWFAFNCWYYLVHGRKSMLREGSLNCF